MRVLFDHPFPFGLTHGGFQIQIEQSKAALEGVGVKVEYLRWWDATQKGDIIHFFGRPEEAMVQAAQSKGFKIVMAELLTETGSRSKVVLSMQRNLIRLAQCVLPHSFRTRMAWESYRLADALIAGTSWEAHLMAELFQAPKERIHVIQNGVEEVFFREETRLPEEWLICTATITERKRVFELAEAAILARTPIRIVGKPYHEKDPYYCKFRSVAAQHPSLVRFEGPVHDRAKLAAIYQQARGFVLLSTMESLSLSALEAAAAGCPLLLSDLPWARAAFGQDARYCSIGSTQITAKALRDFYDQAPQLPTPARPKTWLEIGKQFKTLYEYLLNSSR